MKQPLQLQINDRRREQREHLAHQQAADHGNTQRLTQLGTDAETEHQRQRAEQGGEGGHDNRSEAGDAGLINGLVRPEALLALGLQGKVHQQNTVLFDDTDQQHHADQGHDREVLAHHPQQQQCADTCRGQGGDDGQRVHEAFIEHPQNDVHRHQRREDQPRLVGQRALERLCRTLEAADDRGGHADLVLGLIEHAHGIAQGDPGCQVERQVRRRKHPVMADR